MKITMRPCLRCLDVSRAAVQLANNYGPRLVAQNFVHNGPERIPSFLLPAFSQQRSFSISTAAKLPPLPKMSSISGSAAQRSIPRTFTTSSSRRAVVVTANPRRDDDGNEMLIDITPRASKASLRFTFLYCSLFPLRTPRLTPLSAFEK